MVQVVAVVAGQRKARRQRARPPVMVPTPSTTLVEPAPIQVGRVVQVVGALVLSVMMGPQIAPSIPERRQKAAQVCSQAYLE